MRILLFLSLFISVLFASNSYILNTFNFPPYINKKEGLVLDIVKELFKNSNISYNIKTLPQARAIQKTKYSELNIITPIQRSQEREADFKWVGPILITQTALFTLKNSDLKIDVLNDIKRNKVLVVRGSSEEEYLKSFGFNIDAVKTDLQNANKLRVQRAKIWATDTISASYFSRKSNISIKKHLIFMTTLRSLAFNINTSDETIELLNKNLQKMYSDGTIEKLLLRYSSKFDTRDILKFFH